MKISYTLTLWGNQHKETKYGRERNIDFCCEEMKDVWAWGAGIAFDHDTASVRNCGRDEGGDMEFGGQPFKFCPFCAEPIELVQVGETDNRERACVAVLARRNYWDEGKPILCSKKALPDSDYCAQHTRRHQAEVMAAAMREA